MGVNTYSLTRIPFGVASFTDGPTTALTTVGGEFAPLERDSVLVGLALVVRQFTPGASPDPVAWITIDLFDDGGETLIGSTIVYFPTINAGGRVEVPLLVATQGAKAPVVKLSWSGGTGSDASVTLFAQQRGFAR